MRSALNRTDLSIGKLKCVRLLLFHGADPNSRTRCGATAAHLAAERGNQDCLELLVKYNASIDIEDNVGAIPIDVARAYGNKHCVQYLEMLDGLGKASVKNQLMTKVAR